MPRVRQVHTCPEAPHTPDIAAATAASRSASGKMIDALFPPSSRLTRLTRAAAAAWIALPVGPEPANVTPSTPRVPPSAAPTTAPDPCTTLNQPRAVPGPR